MLSKYEQFSKAVDVLNFLKSEKGFDITFGMDYTRISGKEDIKRRVLKEKEISNDEFDEHMPLILEIMRTIFHNDEDKLILSREKEDSDITKKVELVRSSLVDELLKEKYIISNTYKTNLLDKFDWEIVRKDYDKEFGNLDTFPTAILRFRIKHPFTDDPPVERTQTFVFESSKHQIDILIKELEEIKKKISLYGGD